MTPKIARFLDEQRPATPVLVVDLDVIERNYRHIAALLPTAAVFYAVKANPAPQVLDRLVALGSSFDAASVPEIEACLAAGAPASRVSFGNTIKKEADIRRAFELGVPLYAFDAAAELKKLAAAAPGARVFCRIALDDADAAWPMSGKFGCSIEMARDLLLGAAEAGLDPHGVSFHVGSQQCDVGQWDVAIGKSAMLFSDLAERGVTLSLLNIGGGFPVPYRTAVPTLDDVIAAVQRALTRHFGNMLPELIVEPGRAIAADAGVIRSEVVLIARKDYDTRTRWVYLDIGRFGGLAETMDEAIQYELRVAGRGGGRSGGRSGGRHRADTAGGPVVLAGPTCDGADILYSRAGYTLPEDLEIGDAVDILSAGAYTATYASVGFNGFAPPATFYI